MNKSTLDYFVEKELIDSFDSIRFPNGISSRELKCGTEKEAYRWANVFKNLCFSGNFMYKGNGMILLYTTEENFAHFFTYAEGTYWNIYDEAPRYRL